jgi:hypothetical protein
MVHTATLSRVVRGRHSFQTASQERNGVTNNERERTAMSIETRMAIEQSRAMPPCSESGVSVRYETKVLPHWDRQEWAEVAHAFTYEIAWIPERQCWRSFLCSVSKVG